MADCCALAVSIEIGADTNVSATAAGAKKWRKGPDYVEGLLFHRVRIFVIYRGPWQNFYRFGALGIFNPLACPSRLTIRPFDAVVFQMNAYAYPIRTI